MRWGAYTGTSNVRYTLRQLRKTGNTITSSIVVSNLVGLVTTILNGSVGDAYGMDVYSDGVLVSGSDLLMPGSPFVGVVPVGTTLDAALVGTSASGRKLLQNPALILWTLDKIAKAATTAKRIDTCALIL